MRRERIPQHPWFKPKWIWNENIMRLTNSAHTPTHTGCALVTPIILLSVCIYCRYQVIHSHTDRSTEQQQQSSWKDNNIGQNLLLQNIYLPFVFCAMQMGSLFSRALHLLWTHLHHTRRAVNRGGITLDFAEKYEQKECRVRNTQNVYVCFSHSVRILKQMI